jgi:hypothetical protein
MLNQAIVVHLKAMKEQNSVFGLAISCRWSLHFSFSLRFGGWRAEHPQPSQVAVSKQLRSEGIKFVIKNPVFGLMLAVLF